MCFLAHSIEPNLQKAVYARTILIEMLAMIGRIFIYRVKIIVQILGLDNEVRTLFYIKVLSTQHTAHL